MDSAGLLFLLCPTAHALSVVHRMECRLEAAALQFHGGQAMTRSQDRFAQLLFVIRINHDAFPSSAGGHIELLLRNREDRRGPLSDQDLVHGFALGRVARDAIAILNMAVLSINDPSIGQLDMAAQGKSSNFIDRAIEEPVRSVHCPSILGNPNPVPTSDLDGLRFIHLKSLRLMQRQRSGFAVPVLNENRIIVAPQDPDLFPCPKSRSVLVKLYDLPGQIVVWTGSLSVREHEVFQFFKLALSRSDPAGILQVLPNL